MKLLRVLYPGPVVLPLVLTLVATVAVLALACATPDEATEQHGEAEATSQINVQNEGHTEANALHEADHGEAAGLREHGEGAGHDSVATPHQGTSDHDDAIASHEEGDESADVLEITLEAVEGRAWRFEPAVLELPLGQRVKLTLVNDGRAEHDVEFTGVPAEHVELMGGEDHQRLGGGHHGDGVVAAHAAPGTTATVIFTPTKIGEYEYYCTIPGHREAGMFGRAVVSP